MQSDKKKKRLIVKNMLLDAQGKSDTPAHLNRKIESIGPLRKKKWVEEIQL